MDRDENAPAFTNPLITNVADSDDEDVFDKIDNPFSLSQRPSQQLSKFCFARKRANNEFNGSDEDDVVSVNGPEVSGTSGFGAGNLPRSVSAGNIFPIDGKPKTGVVTHKMIIKNQVDLTLEDDIPSSGVPSSSNKINVNKLEAAQTSASRQEKKSREKEEAKKKVKEKEGSTEKKANAREKKTEGAVEHKNKKESDEKNGAKMKENNKKKDHKPEKLSASNSKKEHIEKEKEHKEKEKEHKEKEKEKENKEKEKEHKEKEKENKEKENKQKENKEKDNKEKDNKEKEHKEKENKEKEKRNEDKKATDNDKKRKSDEKGPEKSVIEKTKELGEDDMGKEKAQTTTRERSEPTPLNNIEDKASDTINIDKDEASEGNLDTNPNKLLAARKQLVEDTQDIINEADDDNATTNKTTGEKQQEKSLANNDDISDFKPDQKHKSKEKAKKETKAKGKDAIGKLETNNDKARAKEHKKAREEAKDLQEKDNGEDKENAFIGKNRNGTEAEDRCLICAQQLSHLSYLDREKHVNDCLDKTNDTRPAESEHKFVCDVCKKDITHLDEKRRSVHINRCLDVTTKTIQTTPKSKKHAAKDKPKVSLYSCPICGKDQSPIPLKGRVTHLKNCAKKYDVPTHQLANLYPVHTTTTNPPPLFHTESTNKPDQTTEKQKEKNTPENTKKDQQEPEKHEPTTVINEIEKQHKDDDVKRSRFFKDMQKDTNDDMADFLGAIEKTKQPYAATTSVITSGTLKRRSKKIRESEPKSKDHENVLTAMALSASEHQSQAPEEVFEAIPVSSPFKDLAGFKMPERNDSTQQRIKALALASIFPEKEAEKEMIDVTPTPKFGVSSVAAKRKVSIPVATTPRSLWKIASGLGGEGDTPTKPTEQLLVTDETKQLSDDESKKDQPTTLRDSVVQDPSSSPEVQSGNSSARIHLVYESPYESEEEEDDEEDESAQKPIEEDEIPAVEMEELLNAMGEVTQGEQDEETYDDQATQTKDQTTAEEDAANSDKEEEERNANEEQADSGREDNVKEAQQSEGEEEEEEDLQDQRKKKKRPERDYQPEENTTKHKKVSLKKRASDVSSIEITGSQEINSDSSQEIFSDGDTQPTAKREKKHKSKRERDTDSNRKIAHITNSPDISSSNDSEASMKAKEIMEEYAHACKKRKTALEKKVKKLQDEFYSEIGRLTMDKDRKLTKLRREYSFSGQGFVFEAAPLSPPHYYDDTLATQSTDEREERDKKRQKKSKSDKRVNQYEDKHNSPAKFHKSLSPLRITSSPLPPPSPLTAPEPTFTPSPALNDSPFPPASQKSPSPNKHNKQLASHSVFDTLDDDIANYSFSNYSTPTTTNVINIQSKNPPQNFTSFSTSSSISTTFSFPKTSPMKESPIFDLTSPAADAFISTKTNKPNKNQDKPEKTNAKLTTPPKTTKPVTTPLRAVKNYDSVSNYDDVIDLMGNNDFNLAQTPPPLARALSRNRDKSPPALRADDDDDIIDLFSPVHYSHQDSLGSLPSNLASHDTFLESLQQNNSKQQPRIQNPVSKNNQQSTNTNTTNKPNSTNNNQQNTNIQHNQNAENRPRPNFSNTANSNVNNVQQQNQNTNNQNANNQNANNQNANNQNSNNQITNNQNTNNNQVYSRNHFTNKFANYLSKSSGDLSGLLATQNINNGTNTLDNNTNTNVNNNNNSNKNTHQNQSVRSNLGNNNTNSNSNVQYQQNQQPQNKQPQNQQPPNKQPQNKQNNNATRQQQISANAPVRPDYESMNNDQLKTKLSQYGVKSGSRQYMLTTINRIWTEMHSDTIADSYVPERKEGEGDVDDVTHERVILECIRQNKHIYEQILQYQPVDFEVVLEIVRQDGIKCTKQRLADVLEKQGIGFTNRRTKTKNKSKAVQ